MRKYFFIMAMFFLMFLLSVLAEETSTVDSSGQDVIAPLAQSLNQEEKAFEILRRFDKIQRELIDWDLEMARRAYQVGDVLAAQAKSEDAAYRTKVLVTAYEAFLSHYPNNARAVNYYGEVLYDYVGDQERGLECWKKAEELDPNLSMPANNMAIHYCHCGEYELGFKYLEKALRLEPDNPDYHFNAAQIYLTNRPQIMAYYNWDERKLFEEAMRHSKLATELSPQDYSLAEDYAVNFFASMNMPSVEVDWKVAADAWERARALARHRDKVFYTWLNEARASLRGKDYRRAEKCLEEALKIYPDNPTCKQLLEQARQGKRTS